MGSGPPKFTRATTLGCKAGGPWASLRAGWMARDAGTISVTKLQILAGPLLIRRRVLGQHPRGCRRRRSAGSSESAAMGSVLLYIFLL
jgi:hypothetical protein